MESNTQSDTITPVESVLQFDKTAANISASLGIIPERASVIDKEYDTAISTFLDEVIQPKKLEGGFGIQFTSADLYAAVAQIPQTPAEAFYVGQNVGRAAEKMRVTVENMMGGMSNRPGFGRSTDPLMNMLNVLMGKERDSLNKSGEKDDCDCGICQLRRSLHK